MACRGPTMRYGNIKSAPALHLLYYVTCVCIYKAPPHSSPSYLEITMNLKSLAALTLVASAAPLAVAGPFAYALCQTGAFPLTHRPTLYSRYHQAATCLQFRVTLLQVSLSGRWPPLRRHPSSWRATAPRELAWQGVLFCSLPQPLEWLVG